MENILSESQFENHLRNDILVPILNDLTDFHLYNFKKAVDVLIVKNGEAPKLFFLEIKYHKNSHGRLGFGQARGAGFQPEVLRNRTDYFENNLRWILGCEDSEQYWFVDNNIIRSYFNGAAVGEKYNGIKLSFFREVPSISLETLAIQIRAWLIH
ncbi:MAG: hypothetical protein IPM77_15070 [Crocinitomicaceae bacterium]|nr:hypothetical protein [Crocinitomicaceae bacterium]